MTAAYASAFAGFDFDRHVMVDSHDLDESRQAIGRVFNPHQLRVLGHGRGLHTRMEHCRVGELALNRLGWGTRVAVDPGELGRYYLISAPLRGRASFVLDGRTTEVSPACAALVNPTQRFHFDTSDSFRQVVVRIERSTIEAAWQALSGRPCEAPIQLDTALPMGGQAWSALHPVLRLLTHSASQTQAPAALPHLHARLAELLATTLLLQQPHADLRAWRGDRQTPRPSRVRAAESWMLEHLSEPITAGAVARACGMPLRSLQTAFQRSHACGPMAWLREQRLQAVRARLAQGAASVTDVALTHGFGHLGEFARAYRLRFGETPSTTRRRSA